MHFMRMIRKPALLTAVVCLAAFIAVPEAFASGVSTLTLTPSGSNTVFTITGTYLPGTQTTSFSSPGASYTLTFSLLTSPTSFVETAPGPGGDFGLIATLDLNGTTFASSEVLFFQAVGGIPSGGMAICFSEVCPTSSNPPIFWDVFQPAGQQLYTSSALDGISNPTFVSGNITLDTTDSGYGISVPTAPTPEPSSLLLLGTGLLGLIGWGRRKLSA